ncbi:uncharacterized protein [Nicotiana sylvestris]|uniref:uncharacterized protein n=1 Tax=Nicotiana sylvestris TaxID=4096 RepID=UPI00388CDB49
MYVAKGAYVMRGPINPPRLNEPVVIGRAPQKPMIDPTTVPWNYNKMVVTYKGKKISGEVQENNPVEKYSNLEEVNNATRKRFPSKKPVSAEEAETFFQKMKMADYEVINQLRKFPEQVSLLALLMNSAEHQKVLIKTLNEAYVPVKTSVEQLERIAERFFVINQISFSKNDFPPEGAAHNKALHLTVKCEGYYVKRVLLDGGSEVDICPVSKRMKLGTERIRPNNVCVRAFDGIKRDTIGEIDLILTIGPVDFEVNFQVLDMDTSYNFLLGRPRIHAAGAIPSTLQQMVNFEHEDQEIVVHEEDGQLIYRDPSVPCLEAREGSEHIVYQAFEIVVADQHEEGNPCPQPFFSNASIMVAKEMIKHGFKSGKGFGKSLQGIAEPITLSASEKFFGVGFRPTLADIRWVDDRKNDVWVLPQPVLHLYRIFVKPKYHEEEKDEAFTAEGIEEICGTMRKILYETHMVQPGEGSGTAEVLYNNAALNNMTCLGTSCPDPNTMSNCEIMNQEPEYDEEEAFREINRELEQFENKPKPNLNDTELVNLGSSEEVRESKISIHVNEKTRDALIQLLFEFKDQKQRKFKTDVSDKIKEEVTKQLKVGVIRVVRYTTSLANVVPVPKKDGKTRKDVAVKWTVECQDAFDKIKEYLSNPPVLVPPEPGRPLFLYLIVLKNSFGCVLGKHDVTGKREQSIYYLSKKFSSYEAKYTLVERTCWALTWVAQKLRHYLQAYIAYLITRLYPLKYIYQKPMPTGRLAKWQILLTEFDIVYVTHTTMKAQALADHLAENSIDDDYQPLNTYFPDEEVNSVETISEDVNAWKMFFDGAVNTKGVGIGAILISPTG